MGEPDRGYLVVGATGRTGGYAVRQLLDRGHRVTTVVGGLDGRAAALSAAGAEVMVADPSEINALTAAMDAARGALLIPAVRPGRAEAAATFAEAAARAGVTHIVNISDLLARRDAGSTALQELWLSEQILDASTVPVTHLRAGLRAEWLATFGVYTHGGGTLRQPMGQARHAPLASEDLARAAVTVLQEPPPHAGATYRLTGPVEMDHHDIARAIGGALGRPVTYAPTDTATWITALHMLNASAFLTQHLSSVVRDYRAGLCAGTTDAVEALTGAKPMTVEEFVTRNLASFGADR